MNIHIGAQIITSTHVLSYFTWLSLNISTSCYLYYFSAIIQREQVCLLLLNIIWHLSLHRKITMTWGCEYLDVLQCTLPPVGGGTPSSSTERCRLRTATARVWTSHSVQSPGDNITSLITSNRITQQQASTPGKFSAFEAHLRWTLDCLNHRCTLFTCASQWGQRERDSASR